MPGFFIIKANGESQKYSSKKLTTSLAKTGAPHFLINKVNEEIHSLISHGTSTKKIYELARKKLHEEYRPSSYRYALKRGIFRLGPSGFPFEQLMARLLTGMGYDTTTNEMIHGKCVRHEVDIRGTTQKELIWGECKFHNVQGSVVDLKTSLYVYARFLDLKENSDDHRKKTMWLITNTRLTAEAIQFAQCREMKILGWELPQGQGLNQLLELFKGGVITCQDFQKNKKKVMRAGVSESQWSKLNHDFNILHSK
jgi:hypothetical protein